MKGGTFGKVRGSKLRFRRGELARVLVAPREHLAELGLEAGVFQEQVGDFDPLLEDGRLPASARKRRLKHLLEKMSQENPEPRTKLGKLLSAQGLDLLDEVRQIGFRKTAVPDQGGLLLRPGIEIPVIQVCAGRVGGIVHADLLREGLPRDFYYGARESQSSHRHDFRRAAFCAPYAAVTFSINGAYAMTTSVDVGMEGQATYGMASLRPERTGLPFIVFISQRDEARHAARAKVSPAPKVRPDRMGIYLLS